MLANANDNENTYASEEEAGSLYFSQLNMVMMLAGINEFKFIAGSYALVENVGVTLIEPLLAILPKPLQCLRIGPLASPATYTARDWFITNCLCLLTAYLYFTLNYKESSVCGPPDGWVWNTEKMIGDTMRPYPNGVTTPLPATNIQQRSTGCFSWSWGRSPRATATSSVFTWDPSALAPRCSWHASCSG